MFVIAPLASRKMNSNMNSQIISFRDILCKMFGNFKLLRSHTSNNLLCVFGKSIIQINYFYFQMTKNRNIIFTNIICWCKF